MIDLLSRFTGTTLAGLATVAALTVPTVEYQLTATALILSGNDYPVIDDGTMAAILGGYFGNDTRVNIYWPAQTWPESGWDSLTLGQSIAVGVANLDDAIHSTPGPKVAAGISGSSQIIDEEMRRLANDPKAPPPGELSFVVIGDANRGMLRSWEGHYFPGLDYVPTVPVTPYDVTVVAGEYDGFGDWPDRPWNLLADLNAFAGTGTIPGFTSEHYQSIWADLSKVPAKNITTTTNSKGGTTTTYIVPTDELPLLGPLHDYGVPDKTIAALNRFLKPIVDAGYTRNDIRSTGRPRRPVTVTAATSQHKRDAAPTRSVGHLAKRSAHTG
ncbi:PE-PPE domain-containing protein [Mycolicibacterium sp. CH28]|uniref:PE-PPE domain-containing protein n=1 Tax=Mycolicibacterium sp. CH28 TaxID=2512237 RepID=UPI0010818A8A|nr:PE-PPE domain-containing protein [Mycolicibacterium sp. CH28]TGD85556.1 PE-PPE domain-containing protein [Mycolicibacterium sp. CH28]